MNVGKTHTIKYLLDKYEDKEYEKGVVVFLSDNYKPSNAYNCIFNAIMEKDKKNPNKYNRYLDLRAVLINFPNDTDINNPNIYKSLENIKDGIILNEKYTVSKCKFPNPHVIICANKPPCDTINGRINVFEIYEDYNYGAYDMNKHTSYPNDTQ